MEFAVDYKEHCATAVRDTLDAIETYGLKVNHIIELRVSFVNGISSPWWFLAFRLASVTY